MTDRSGAAEDLRAEAQMIASLYTSMKARGFTRLSALKEGVITALTSAFPLGLGAVWTASNEGRAAMVEACMNAGLAQMKAWASEIEHPSYGPLSDAEFQRVMRQSETLKHGLLDIAEPDGDVNAGVSAVLDVIRAEPNGWGY